MHTDDFPSCVARAGDPSRVASQQQNIRPTDEVEDRQESSKGDYDTGYRARLFPLEPRGRVTTSERAEGDVRQTTVESRSELGSGLPFPPPKQLDLSPSRYFLGRADRRVSQVGVLENSAHQSDDKTVNSSVPKSQVSSDVLGSGAWTESSKQTAHSENNSSSSNPGTRSIGGYSGSTNGANSHSNSGTKRSCNTDGGDGDQEDNPPPKQMKNLAHDALAGLNPPRYACVYYKWDPWGCRLCFTPHGKNRDGGAETFSKVKLVLIYRETSIFPQDFMLTALIDPTCSGVMIFRLDAGDAGALTPSRGRWKNTNARTLV